MSTPFEKLFDKLDALNICLDEGPTGTDEQFLEAVRNYAQDIVNLTQVLTPEMVEEEFTDEDDEDEDVEEGKYDSFTETETALNG